MDRPLIQLEDIKRTYHIGEFDVPVLKGINLSIQRGELVALTGASGSGKTTLMNTLGCLDRPTSGRYWLDGDEITQLSNDGRARIRNLKIGFVFQLFNLLPRTTALEQVTMPLAYSASGISDREARTRAKALLTKVGLAERMDHTPSQLSGGQQQRVAIARALINHPPRVVCGRTHRQPGFQNHAGSPGHAATAQHRGRHHHCDRHARSSRGGPRAARRSPA